VAATDPRYTLMEEDRARAAGYALIARLFYAPPDEALLARLAAGASGEWSSRATAVEPGAYERAYAALQQASRASRAEDLRQTYDDLFVGAGRAAVTPYTSAYAAPHAPDRHLLALRERLHAVGLERKATAFEYEDHVSAVCEVMRWLIERERPLEEQLDFFERFVESGVPPFCAAVEARAGEPFYTSSAALARALVAVEREAFDLEAHP
jgi:TorA maturation chaperone TorD